MSNYKHFKHYYDPYDSLDVEWQNVVSKGHLTISEVVSLSGYTKSYVYRLVKDGIIPCMNGESGKLVRWIDFIHWYSHLPETPASPIGEASFSIAGLIKLTGMGRCWLLKLVTRYGVRSYNVGWLKRYNKEDVMSAWAEASCYVKPWLSIDEAMMIIETDRKALFRAVAQNIVHIRHDKGVLLFNAHDLKRWKEDCYE